MLAIDHIAIDAMLRMPSRQPTAAATRLLLAGLILASGSQFADAEDVVTEPAFRTVTLSGFTRARQSLSLSFDLAGRVVSVNADIGDTLAEGQAYACLDTTFIALERAENRSLRRRTEANIRFFSKQVERLKRLAAANNSAQSQLDDSQRELQTSRADLARQRTQDKTLAERERRHCVKPPSGWVLTERMVEPGQWARSGEPIGTAKNFNTLLIPLSVSTEELTALRSQASWPIYLPEIRQRTSAHIERMSPAFDPNTRKIALDLAITGIDGFSRGGLLAELNIELPEAGVVQIDQRAVVRRYEEEFLLRTDGSRLPISVLGTAASKDKLLVSAPGLSAGQPFRLPALATEN